MARVQVLRLLETFDLENLHAAVKTALCMGAIHWPTGECKHSPQGGFDAIKHLILCQVEKRPPKLDLDVYSVQIPALSAQGEGWHHPGRQLHLLEAGECGMTEAPKILLDHHLESRHLPSVRREYGKLARPAAEGLDHVQFLARLVELELIDRERRMIERRIKAAKFPAVKSPPLTVCRQTIARCLAGHACMPEKGATDKAFWV